MSLYVEWVNKIKTGADATWLTDAQREVYDLLTSRWQHAQFVCLSGSAGVGKTFVAWVLSKEQGAHYASSIADVPVGVTQVVIDGQEYSRLMRPTAALLGAQRVIVLMRRAPSEAMPKAEIILTDRDVKRFQHNLVAHGILESFRTEVRGTDLGQILRTEAVARG